jgi:putative hydrolase of the HAD superfamily
VAGAARGVGGCGRLVAGTDQVGDNVPMGKHSTALNQTSDTRVLSAVLFDSGGVLMQPIGGRWNPRADFERTVLDHDRSVTRDRFAAGIAAGDRFFAESDSTPEYDGYHRVILSELGVAATPELLAALVRPVAPDQILETFPEVIDTLTELRRRGVRMAVVSDAWPDLPDLHAGLGIHEFFEAYAISRVLGCTKPDPRMYQYASNALGLEPEQCLFIDDDPNLVAAAINLGYAGLAMLRDTPSTAAEEYTEAADEHPEVASISSLTSIIDLF